MGFDLHIPKQLQDEIHKAAPHLRIILPAAAAVVWVIGKVIPRGKPHEETTIEGEDEDAGIVVAVELPRGVKGLPFTPPRPLRTTVLSAAFPVSIRALWEHLMSGNSQELAEFHTAMGEQAVSLSPWRQNAEGARARVLRFTTPLKNRMGPKQAVNREELSVGFLGPDAFVVSATATSQGVPFSSCFVNRVQWVAQSEGADVTRLTITVDCEFVSPVWGPLKGTIHRESVRGMSSAYADLKTRLTERFGAVEGEEEKAVAAATGSAVALSLLQSSQAANPAVLVVMVAVFILMWRMALLNALSVQIFSRLAQARV